MVLINCYTNYFSIYEGRNYKNIYMFIEKKSSISINLNGNLSDSGLLITGSVIYQKRYGFVYVSFSGAHVNSIHTWETIATLPEGFRPSNTVCGTAYSTDLSAALYMIEVSGNVNIFASNVAIGLAANTMFIAK